jgi:hypothetical protein
MLISTSAAIERRADKFSSMASSLLIRVGAIAAARSSCSADRDALCC